MTAIQRRREDRPAEAEAEAEAAGWRGGVGAADPDEVKSPRAEGGDSVTRQGGRLTVVGSSGLGSGGRWVGAVRVREPWRVARTPRGRESWRQFTPRAGIAAKGKGVV